MFKIFHFIAYWYMRYLLVSELYLVEKWERMMIHIIILALFLGTWYINKTFLQFITNCMS